MTKAADQSGTQRDAHSSNTAGAAASKGLVYLVGAGPGAPGLITLDAVRCLNRADVVIYDYLASPRLLEHAPPHAERILVGKHGGGQRVEQAVITELLLERARRGLTVARLKGGDPFVFGRGGEEAEALAAAGVRFEIVPGVTAMLAVAACIGAPLGHDFCAISLSDNLKPWEVVERRLVAAAEAGFVIALYNPISKARPWQLGKAFERLRAVLPADTIVVFGRAAGRSDERIEVFPLGEADADKADMATCVIIGSTETREIPRAGRRPLIYTPRSLASQ